MAKPDAPKKKSRGLRTFLLILLVALFGVGGFFAYRMMKGLELPRAPLANAPRSATIVGYVRVQNLLRSQVVRTVLRREVLEERIETLRQRCGFDPTTQLDDVIAFVRGNEASSLGSLGLVARGPFEHEKLQRCLREAVAEEGLGEMRRGLIEGEPALIPSNSEQRAVMLGMRGVTIGEERTVREVVKVVRDHRPSAAADPVLARMWDLVAGGRDVVLVGHVPPNWQSVLGDAVAPGVSARIGGALDGLEAFGLGADVSDGLRIGAVLEMHDAATATALATRVRAQIDELTNNMLVSLTPIGPIVRAIHTEQRNLDFIVTLDLPRDRLDRMIEFATAWQNNRNERATPGQAPGTAPTPVPDLDVHPTP